MKKTLKFNLGGKNYFIALTKDGAVFGKSESPKHITIYSKPQEGLLANLHTTNQLEAGRTRQKQILNIRQGDSLSKYQKARQELVKNLKKFEITSKESVYVMPENAMKELVHFTIKETKKSFTITTEDLDTLAEKVMKKVEPIPISKKDFLNNQYEIGFTLKGELVPKICGCVVIYSEEVDKMIKKSKYWKMLNLEYLNIE